MLRTNTMYNSQEWKKRREQINIVNRSVAFTRNQLSGRISVRQIRFFEVCFTHAGNNNETLLPVNWTRLHRQSLHRRPIGIPCQRDAAPNNTERTTNKSVSRCRFCVAHEFISDWKTIGHCIRTGSALQFGSCCTVFFFFINIWAFGKWISKQRLRKHYKNNSELQSLPVCTFLHPA